MIRVNVSVDDKNIRRRLKNLEQSIDKGIGSELDLAGRKLRDLVKLRMPKSSASSPSAKSIIVSKRDFKGTKALLLTQNFRPHPEKTWKGMWFNVPRWMFKARKKDVVKHYVKSGNVALMRDTPGQVFEEFKFKVVQRFKYSWRK